MKIKNILLINFPLYFQHIFILMGPKVWFSLYTRTNSRLKPVLGKLGFGFFYLKKWGLQLRTLNPEEFGLLFLNQALQLRTLNPQEFGFF